MLTTYTPWNAVRQLHDEFNRNIGQSPSRVRDTGAPAAWMPAADVHEEAARFLVTADIPGVDPEDIEITVDDGMLTIRGERNLEAPEDGAESGYRRVERTHGRFYRRFTLPDTADAEAVSAVGNNGVLEITIPKKETLQGKRIKVAA